MSQRDSGLGNGRRGERGGDTRARLLAVAEELVRARGFNGFSYADLAKAVGVRTASIHYHFPNKTDLGLALVEAYDARYEAAMAAIARESEDGARRVRAYAALYAGGLEQNLGCLCAMLAASPDLLSAPMRAATRAFFRKHVAWLRDVIAAGRANGTAREGPDAEELARSIVALLEGALLLERLLDGPEGFRSALAAIERLVAPDAGAAERPTTAPARSG
ncbi:TetR/AcrR family transcriptional regulator [Methylocella sp.]|uniref:TetR/AcrR family transcriptional regulator n=1 Tax=Methylocella sp. TaxID=1978226 RepID=UPI0035ADF7A9